MRRNHKRRSATGGVLSAKKPRRRFAFLFVLPAAYVIASILLSGPFGGAGHGWGVGAFIDLSMPAGLLGFLADELFRRETIFVPVCFLAAVAQYALIGYLIDRLRHRRKRAK
jgi:hypothetical protein